MEKITFKTATIEQIVEFINKEWEGNPKATLKTIAPLIDAKDSTLSSFLGKHGYVCKNRQYVKKDTNVTPELGAEDLMYLLNSSFTKQMSARVSEDTYKSFAGLCESKYPNIPIAKLISLALKEFTEKHK